MHPSKEGEKAKKAVRIWKAGLQYFDPLCPTRPLEGGEVELFASLGGDEAPWVDPGVEAKVQEGEGYDLVMIQWCIGSSRFFLRLVSSRSRSNLAGHLSDDELVAFLERSRRALRQSADGTCEGFIVLKENVCKDTDGNGDSRLFDDEDSSITRCVSCASPLPLRSC